jgi:hypothetical protein
MPDGQFWEVLPLVLSGFAVTFSFITLSAYLRLVARYRDALSKNRHLIGEINQYYENLRDGDLLVPSQEEIDQLNVEMVEKIILQGMSEEDAKQEIMKKYRKATFFDED